MHYSQVIDFWFGSLTCPKHRILLPWLNDSLVDEERCVQFYSLLSEVGEGKRGDWLTKPLGRLAQIILLDQIARRKYKGQASAYRYDEFALALCKNGLARHHDEQLMPIQRLFFYLPLLHSEQVEDQIESCFFYQRLIHNDFTDRKKFFLNFYYLALDNYEIIGRFKRFPERNASLGRISTKEELNWMKAKLSMK